MDKKLILFDIDGTLILTGGVASRVMIDGVARVLGHPIRWSVRDFVGNTDRSIIAKLLIQNGATEAQTEKMVEQALQYYLEHLPAALARDGVVRILPGVLPLLEKLSADSRFALGLVTGNVYEGARIKLSRGNLFAYFPVGAFGDDALKREELPPFAIQRAEKYYNHFFDRENIWIVGDSANDVKCARANHLKSLAVGSGVIPTEELAESKPTVLLPDLSDMDAVLDIFSR